MGWGWGWGWVGWLSLGWAMYRAPSVLKILQKVRKNTSKNSEKYSEKYSRKFGKIFWKIWKNTPQNQDPIVKITFSDYAPQVVYTKSRKKSELFGDILLFR